MGSRGAPSGPPLGFEIAVDDIDGTLHRQFSPKPNSAYVINTDGTIAYRAHWANDESGLRRGLEAVTSGRTPERGSSRTMIRPLMRAVGHLPGIVHDGGPKIERDVWRAAPPLAILGRLSLLFRAMPFDRRRPMAAVALAVTVLAATAVGVVLWT